MAIRSFIEAACDEPGCVQTVRLAFEGTGFISPGKLATRLRQDHGWASSGYGSLRCVAHRRRPVAFHAFYPMGGNPASTICRPCGRLRSDFAHGPRLDGVPG